jgi:SAM-dependent methyltransferase
MVELARRHAAESGTAEHVSVDVGDAYSLAFEDASFDLVLAIGVMDYLTRPELAMREIARVTGPGGHVILTDLNPSGLTIRLDPWDNPALRPFMVPMKGALARGKPRPWSPDKTYHSRRVIDETLVSARLAKVCGKTLGFGPFTFLRRRVLPVGLGLALHHRLQSLADRGMPVLRSTGVCYLVLARKPACQHQPDNPM